MTESRQQKTSKTQPDSAGGPPAPPKKTTLGLEDQSPEEPCIVIPDPVVVRDLASALRQKPFKIIADLLEVGQFANVHASVDFDTALKVAWKHGYYARRVAKQGRCSRKAFRFISS